MSFKVTNTTIQRSVRDDIYYNYNRLVNENGYNKNNFNSISIGCDAGKYDQAPNSIAIGTNAGEYSQGYDAIAIGTNSGHLNQDTFAISIGGGDLAIEEGPYESYQMNQGFGAISIGAGAGNMNQHTGAVSIGFFSGALEQGFASIAIGGGSGDFYQADNSICLMANWSDFYCATGGLYVSPIITHSDDPSINIESGPSYFGYTGFTGPRNIYSLAYNDTSCEVFANSKSYYNSQNGLNVEGGVNAIDGKIRQNGQDLVTVGAIILSAQSSAGGYLLCDGTQYRQIDYPALYGVIGGTYNNSPSAGYFNVPSIGRIGVGHGPSIGYYIKY